VSQKEGEGVTKNNRHWENTEVSPPLVREDKFKLSSMFPCPLLLDTRFFLFRIHSQPLFFLNCLNIISKPTHEYILFSSLEFCRPKVEEGAPKNCRNRRHQENIEIKTDSYHAFLHVPVPTGLRYSLSSSSWLTRSRPHHLSLHKYILFCSLDQFCRLEEEEGAPKNCRKGRHQENTETNVSIHF